VSWGLNPWRGKGFLSSTDFHDLLWGQPSSYARVIGVFARGKAAGHEVDHLLPCSAATKTESKTIFRFPILCKQLSFIF
jgi:hypothetical protein